MSLEARKDITVLFTSAGRRVELLRGFREAHAKLQLGGAILAADVDRLAPAPRVADRAYEVPRIRSAEFVPAVAEICRRERVGIILPLIDPELPVLAQHRRLLEETGARLAIPPYEAVVIAADKWKTAQFISSLGLATPFSWLPGERPVDEIDYPVFIKPRFGSASENAFRVASPKELEFFSSYVPDPVIQELLPGPELTIDVVCDLHGEVLTVVCRQRIQVRGGEVAKGVTVVNSTVIEACARIARAMQAVGPITIQCMMKNDVPHFTEINARLGGGFPLGVAAGANSPLYLLARAAGLPIEIPPLGSYRAGVYMTRFDDSFFCTEDDLGHLRRCDS